MRVTEGGCPLWFGGVGGVRGVSVVCWWCVGGVLLGGWRCPRCRVGGRGVGVAVSMYLCVAWGCCPHGVLVVWWFGGWWWCVWCRCVCVGGVLLGDYTRCGLVCWCVGVLVVCFLRAPPLCGLVVCVVWCVGVNVCVFLLGAVAPCGLVVLVGWWCVGGVLPGGGIAPLWVGGRVVVLVWWCPCMCVLPGS